MGTLRLPSHPPPKALRGLISSLSIKKSKQFRLPARADAAPGLKPWEPIYDQLLPSLLQVGCQTRSKANDLNH